METVYRHHDGVRLSHNGQGHAHHAFRIMPGCRLEEPMKPIICFSVTVAGLLFVILAPCSAQGVNPTVSDN